MQGKDEVFCIYTLKKSCFPSRETAQLHFIESKKLLKKIMC